jgi:ATP-dependent protease HslVU (ClpYQ) peptidase subunit
MTVAVAVRKQGRTVVAADSLVNFGGERYPNDNSRFRKIQEVGDSLMVWSGWSLYAELLTAHLSRQPPPSLHNEAEVFSFFVSFWRALQEEYTLLQPRGSREHPFGELDSVFLLANRSGVFRISSDLDVTEFNRFAAIGSGSKYALGALQVLYACEEDPLEIARRAVQVGIDSNVYCGGPIDVAEVKP